MQIVCQNRREKRSHPILDSLSVLSKAKGERGAVNADVHSSTGRLPSNETEMCHRGKGDGEDEQKCRQRI